MLILFWPVGLYLMGRYAPWRARTQMFVKLAIVGTFVGSIGISALAAIIEQDNAPTSNDAENTARFPTSTPDSFGQQAVTPTRTPVVVPTQRPTRVAPATRTPRSNQVPGPAPEHREPGELDVVFENDLTGWPTNATDSGMSFGDTDGYHAVVNAGADFGVGQTTGTTFDDNSASVNVRLIQSSGNASGCLMFRSLANSQSRYDFCLNTYGAVSAYFAGLSGFEQLYSGRLQWDASVTNWNNLKVVFRDTEMRLYVNGTRVHEMHHDGTSTGLVGVIAFNQSSTSNAEFVFRDLVIRDVLVSSARATTPTPRPQPTATRLPRPSPTATAMPSSSVGNGIPAEGAVLYQRPLSEWRSEAYDVGWVEPSATSLYIGVYGGDGEHTVESWTEQNDFANISASVDVREVSRGAAAAGCLAIRHDATDGDYQFCILGNGRTWAVHDFIDAGGTWQVETLLEDSNRQGTKPPSEWNTIKIVASDNRLWFVINGMLVGSISHDARTVGDVAVSVTTWDNDQDAEFEFKNLVVRTVS